MLSNHPLLSASPPTFNLSQHQGLFKWIISSNQMDTSGTGVYLWLIHADVWQKPALHGKAVILQLQMNFQKMSKQFLCMGRKATAVVSNEGGAGPLTKPVEFVQHMLSSVCGRVTRDSGFPPAWVAAPTGGGALCGEPLSFHQERAQAEGSGSRSCLGLLLLLCNCDQGCCDRPPSGPTPHSSW